MGVIQEIFSTSGKGRISEEIEQPHKFMGVFHQVPQGCTYQSASWNVPEARG